MIYNRNFLPLILIVTILLAGCLSTVTYDNNYEEIPSMLDVLTSKVQIAVEDGHLDKGEQAVLEYVSNINPNVYNWFIERGYEIRVGVVSDYAVVMICDKGQPVFEDTYCDSGPPDKDHRGNPNLKSCEITMTDEEVKDICKQTENKEKREVSPGLSKSSH